LIRSETDSLPCGMNRQLMYMLRHTMIEMDELLDRMNFRTPARFWEDVRLSLSLSLSVSVCLHSLSFFLSLPSPSLFSFSLSLSLCLSSLSLSLSLTLFLCHSQWVRFLIAGSATSETSERAYAEWSARYHPDYMTVYR
jgi:hypothetical protein